ncbi:hypothetical protein N7491_009853 [Penicillium cf. griseofulvum]|uniref:Uncharacterized protein n=1 Tax=Penicillium cf. griseofulvum TaxID=2972120 RepID=A0A9W9MYR9_9EURO|nr:hypothetical protein N7472_000179 [Penicillium cf. griseofulvum]KAJ5421408.1 hypothetical protein N7491_009853 [Penicillium cf. griseofulvum]
MHADKLGNLRVKNDAIIRNTTAAFTLSAVVAPRSFVLMSRTVVRQIYTHQLTIRRDKERPNESNDTPSANTSSRKPLSTLRTCEKMERMREAQDANSDPMSIQLSNSFGLHEI